MFEPRTYRNQFNNERFQGINIVHKETDLWIGIDKPSFNEGISDLVSERVKALRNDLDKYIKSDPDFERSLVPYSPKPKCPTIGKQMTEAATKAGIGPMSTVAGLFAKEVGEIISGNFSVNEWVIENGGDIYCQLAETMLISVYAGDSPLSEKVGVIIPPEITPVGICTSAGKVGPSLSFGNADAVMVISKDVGLADALATAFGNELQSARDIEKVIGKLDDYPEVMGLIVIIDGQVGMKSKLEVKLIK